MSLANLNAWPWSHFAWFFFGFWGILRHFTRSNIPCRIVDTHDMQMQQYTTNWQIASTKFSKIFRIFRPKSNTTRHSMRTKCWNRTWHFIAAPVFALIRYGIQYDGIFWNPKKYNPAAGFSIIWCRITASKNAFKALQNLLLNLSYYFDLLKYHAMTEMLKSGFRKYYLRFQWYICKHLYISSLCWYSNWLKLEPI